MAIILDTDVIVESEKEKFDLSGWLASLPEERIEIAAITAAELQPGIERASSKYRVSRERFVRTVLETFPVLPYTGQTAQEHARIWAALEASGKMIRYYDLLIAATALEHGSRLATFNKKHFSLIKGLNLIEPR